MMVFAGSPRTARETLAAAFILRRSCSSNLWLNEQECLKLPELLKENYWSPQPAPPQLPFKRPQIPSNRDQKAFN